MAGGEGRPRLASGKGNRPGPLRARPGPAGPVFVQRRFAYG